MADIFEIIGKLSLDGVETVEKGLNKVSGVAKGVGKAIVGVTGAVATGSVALVKGVQSSFGELQQNLGGSEAVFGQYASEIQKIGEDAYKNMGISQSEYLATANKMASLFQGSGIDQRTSLDLTSKAMQRASDVASVMGIDMTMAMESITGAAKGNFTMMDNLGVAMNATTLEAYAHSKGMENFTWKTASQMEKNTLAMQMFLERTEQYAGNFARESTDTITGSIGYLGASWKDFLAGLGNPTADMSRLTNNLAQSFGAMIDNIVPIIENITKALPSVMDSLIKSAGSMLPTLLSTFTALVKTVLSNLGVLIKEYAPPLLFTLIDSGKMVIDTVISLITEYAPTLLSKGEELLTNLSIGISNNLPMVLDKGLTIISNFADTVSRNAPILISKGIEFIRSLVQGLMSALPTLIERVPEIISKFANVINDNAPTIIMGGFGIILDIIKGIIQAIPTLIANIPSIISAVVDTWSAFNWLNLGKTVITAIGKGFTAMIGFAQTSIGSVKNGIITTIQNLPQILMDLGKSAIHNLALTIDGLKSSVINSALRVMRGIESTFLRLPSKMLSIGKELVKGLWNGISNSAGWLLDSIWSFADNIISSVKEAFDINSPSRVMMGLGGFIAEGLGVGIAEDETAENSIRNKVDGMLGIANNSLSNTKLGISGMIAESPLQKYQLDFNGQIGALNDGFERLIALVGAYLPNIAENSAKELDFDGNKLVLGISKKMDMQLGKMALAKGRGNV